MPMPISRSARSGAISLEKSRFRASVEAAQMPQVFGARLTGGGFGSSIVALVTGGEGAAVAADVAQRYRASTGHQPTILVAQELACDPS